MTNTSSEVVEQRDDLEAKGLLVTAGVPRDVADAAVNWVAEHSGDEDALVWARQVVARIVGGGVAERERQVARRIRLAPSSTIGQTTKLWSALTLIQAGMTERELDSMAICSIALRRGRLPSFEDRVELAALRDKLLSWHQGVQGQRELVMVLELVLAMPDGPASGQADLAGAGAVGSNHGEDEAGT